MPFGGDGVLNSSIDLLNDEGRLGVAATTDSDCWGGGEGGGEKEE